MTQRERQLLSWIEENPLISQQELADKAGITRSSVAVHISNLMKKGYISGKGYIIHTAPYVTVVGGVNMDIGGRPAAVPVMQDSNPGTVGMSLGGVGRNIAHNLSLLGVDTRMLTQLLRDGGVMNAVITTEETKPDLEALKAYRVEQSVENTSCAEPETRLPQGEAKYSVALLDYGAKESICNSLLARGCKATVHPYNTPAEDILAAGHDGVMLSNGPGDPADNTFCIQQIQKLFGKLPMFGICLGHQMMALAAGAKTKKLKFGHRGANQPAMDLETGEVSITSQNHGYAVDEATLPGTEGKLRFVNVNDGTCEGVDYPAYHAFSLQFHPEAHGGPLDTLTAFDRFTDMMKEGL